MYAFTVEHNLLLINKLEVGESTYLFKVKQENNTSLEIANNIYKSGSVKASYPDWMYLISGSE